MRKFTKYFIIAICSMITLSFSVDVQAEENDLVVYDYVNQTEYRTSSGLDTNMESGKIDSNLMDESIAESYIPDTLLQQNENILPNSLIDGSQMEEVDPKVFPNSTITYLRIGHDTTGDGKADTWFTGTGFIVGPDVMVTAGHCFWSEEYGWAKEVRTYLKYEHGKTTQYYYPSYWIYSNEYIENGNSEYDWCVVIMQQNVGAMTGWLGFGVSESLVGKDINVAGFAYTDDYSNLCQFQSAGQIISQKERTLNYNASTKRGQSGGPVFDSNGVAWGIHAYGGPSNSGCVIKSSLYELLTRKREEGIEKYN